MLSLHLTIYLFFYYFLSLSHTHTHKHTTSYPPLPHQFPPRRPGPWRGRRCSPSQGLSGACKLVFFLKKLTDFYLNDRSVHFFLSPPIYRSPVFIRICILPMVPVAYRHSCLFSQ